MILKGKLYAESPIYRGNARKTLFTRDNDGTQRLVSLAGEIAGTAQSLMDAFIGQSKNGKNIGLLNELWNRLYRSPLPKDLITKVECKMNRECYPNNNFFDLRMGIKLDEDRWAAESNANYKMETLFKNSYFDFTLYINDRLLKQNDNESKLYYLLDELRAGRFYFGAGKNKGLGKCRLEMEIPFSSDKNFSEINPKANHLFIHLCINAMNPILVGWNWGKIDPEIPAFAAIEGKQLIMAMRNLPAPLKMRLEMTIGGPILDPEDWKKKFADFLPRLIAIYLQEISLKQGDFWILPQKAIKKLSTGKFPLSKKVLSSLEPFCDQPFSSQEEAEEKFKQVMGKKANLISRVMEQIEKQSLSNEKFDNEAWLEIAADLGLPKNLTKTLESSINDEDALMGILKPECDKILPQIYQTIDQQIKLLQSDAWIDMEISNREDHVKIKTLILNQQITESDWHRKDFIPEGIKAPAWKEFLSSHSNVNFRHLANERNLRKSITNDQNHINFLKTYRNRTRQELAQPFNTDFRPGGPFNREISKKYGKPFDTLFMRMLSWKPSSREGEWEIYIPGSTIKGAFRKRASQILKTLWGENSKTSDILDKLFGTMGKRGIIFFSDAYLQVPEVPNSVWCSMDGVRMDAATGKPIEEAKSDYLFACGENLSFQLKLELQDLREHDLETISILSHLLLDFHRGDIPLGGEKTNGFGWSQAEITKIKWLSIKNNEVSKKLFGEKTYKKQGLWDELTLTAEDALKVIKSAESIKTDMDRIPKTPPKANQGFISHRYFGGLCGTLSLKGEILTPTHIKESGEPSFRSIFEGEHINGWDFFSINSPDNSFRKDDRTYALPSKSVRGMIRQIYAIATESAEESKDISQLNPADSLFGWVGSGPNQAIAARLSFDFAVFESPQFSWFKIPYPYGNWQFENGEWKNVPQAQAKISLIADKWRYFPNTPLAPNVEKLDAFEPDSVKAKYFRAILPGSHARLNIRFWNLTEKELQRLIWCFVLEAGLAHKIGNSRYLGFGSLRFKLSENSYLIDWKNRYSDESDNSWRKPISAEDWINLDVIENQEQLRKALNADQI